MDKKTLKTDNATIYQTIENCQVFNGPISGCVFAMPGATVNQSPVQKVAANGYQEPNISGDSNPTYPSTNRQTIIDELLAYSVRGDWADGISMEAVQRLLKNVLGYGSARLSEANADLSEKLWHQLESGRGENKVKVVWAKIVGYMDDHGLIRGHKANPALSMDFFDSKEQANNINKGRPSKERSMSKAWQEVLPLFDAYVPQRPKKCVI